MLATTQSSTLIGLDAFAVEVEVDITRAMPSFDVVGLAEAAVRESRTRVRAAIEQSGYPFPIRRVTVNLAPADVRKAGTGFDLAIAIATLAAAGECAAASLDRWMMLGELSLTGGVRGVRGVLPQVMAARERGVRGAIVATENLAEAAVVGYPHDVKGQGVYCFVTLNADVTPTDVLQADLKGWVRREIGAFAAPDIVQFAPGLPKTRSGKIMRRILRKIAENDLSNLGDTTTLADPAVVDDLVKNRQA